MTVQLAEQLKFTSSLVYCSSALFSPPPAASTNYPSRQNGPSSHRSPQHATNVQVPQSPPGQQVSWLPREFRSFLSRSFFWCTTHLSLCPQILAFYMLFIRMIRLVAHAYRRRRIAVGGCPGNLRYITSSYNDLLAQEDPYGHPHHEHD